MKRSCVLGIASCVAVAAGGLFTTKTAAALDDTEEDYSLKLLGKYVFFDKISNPQRMACATCHDPETGGTGSVSGINLHQVVVTGANPHAAGNLKPPTNGYASFIAPFDECSVGGFRFDDIRYCGGNFWDGRAEGDMALLPGATPHIGEEVFQGSTTAPQLGYAKYFGPTSDQALNPMPNPAEQNISRQEVCEHVEAAKYGPLYELAWGEPIDCSDDEVTHSAPDVPGPELAYDISFKRIMLAVGAWQHSSELNSFSSKRDLALQAELACVAGAPDADPAVCNDPKFTDSPGTFPLVGFTDEENLGHDLFYNSARSSDPAPFPDLPRANCSRCHLSDALLSDGTAPLERYTDDGYHNIGTPANPELPAEPALGISGHAGASERHGGFKTPTLRNVDKRKGNGFTKAYTHNGWFKSLESLVHFYNTARVKPRCTEALTETQALAADCWPEPEWPDTTAPAGLVGAIGMTADQEAALVAYLKTLTDTVTPKAPKPYKANP